MQIALYKNKEYLVINVEEEGKTACYNRKYTLLPMSALNKYKLFNQKNFEKYVKVVSVGSNNDIVKIIREENYEVIVCYKIVKKN